MLERRLEKLNEYDLDYGLMRTVEKLRGNIEQNLDLLDVTEDAEVANRLKRDIENDVAEMKFISSSLLFDKDIMLIVERSNVYRRME